MMGMNLPELPTYRALIPSSLPGKNQQYAFEVDLDQCSACKACVTCHNLNGLKQTKPGEKWERFLAMKKINRFYRPLPPPVIIVWPSLLGKLSEKRMTRIDHRHCNAHLDDQCIGCPILYFCNARMSSPIFKTKKDCSKM